MLGKWCVRGDGAADQGGEGGPLVRQGQPLGITLTAAGYPVADGRYRQRLATLLRNLQLTGQHLVPRQATFAWFERR